MKLLRALLILTLLIAFATPISAANVTEFSWTPGVVDPTHDAPTFYTVKCGAATGGPYATTKSTPTATPPPTTLLVAAVVNAPGTYFCIVTASNVAGESGPSNEVTFRLYVAPNAPGAFKVQ